MPAIFSTRTNPASNESLFSVRVFLPLKKRESFHIKKCTATFLCYLLGLLWQATDTKPQEIQVQQRSGICCLASGCIFADIQTVETEDKISWERIRLLLSLVNLYLQSFDPCSLRVVKKNSAPLSNSNLRYSYILMLMYILY